MQTARLLMDTLRSEALGFLGITDSATQSEMHYRYSATLRPYIEKGVELGLLSPHLLEYDLNVLGQALKADRDQQSDAHGVSDTLGFVSGSARSSTLVALFESRSQMLGVWTGCTLPRLQAAGS